MALETGHFVETERAATKLIGIMPVIPQGYLIRGMARLSQSRSKEAFADFDAGLERIPSRRERREVRDSIVEHVPEFAER